MLWKCCTQYASKFGKLISGTGLEKVSFHSSLYISFHSCLSLPKKGNAKECSNYHTAALISHTCKYSKFSKPGFNSMWTVNFQMFKLENAEEPKIKLPTSVRSLKKQEHSRKTSTSPLLTMTKPLTVWIQQTVENSSRDGNIRPPDLTAETSVCRSRSNS